MRLLLAVCYRSLLIGTLALLLGGCERESLPEPATPPPAEQVPSTTSELAVCEANPGWITHPSPPDEVLVKNEQTCTYHQFAWQWFLSLMSPAADNPELRHFQVASNYVGLQMGQDSCAATTSSPHYFIRTVKREDSSAAFTLPEHPQENSPPSAFYDHNGQPVFYSVIFNRALCEANDSGNLPTHTTELKLAWRLIEAHEKSDYLWVEADVLDEGPERGASNETLGLIGFHLAQSTAKHPAMVWASFEHKNNAPSCLNPDKPPAEGWAFLSQSCQACLQQPDTDCLESCSLNQPQSNSEPSQVCRLFLAGTAPDDQHSQQNLADVTALNTQFTGPEGLLTQLPEDDVMAVLANYFHLGTLWLNDAQQTATPENQRGSRQLASTVMEAPWQGNLQLDNGKLTPSTEGQVNCFGCHQYQPKQTANSGLSHIVDRVRQQR